ncbi:MAG: peptide ABC transporter substrate-binding protein [Ruminococcaceae bacterium]|nr:peptide ABC transporter substrate-binding protein [Oscillospiraceae bacterium]
MHIVKTIGGLYNIMKKLLALLLCFIMILTSLIGCGKKQEDNGAEIRMYISDPVYNFDPAEAYKNEAALKVVSLMFDNLFIMNEKGKVEKSLAKDYKIDKEANTMLIEMRDDTSWSDGNAVTANDVVFAWHRLLDPTNSFEAASLLFDIKNAKACKEGLITVDDIGISALNNTELLITFEDRAIDYDSFLNKLTSLALAPLREDILSKVVVANDWAKSPTLMVASGPFRLRTISYAPEKAGLVLERNAYYRRDFMKDDIDKSVTPYRLIVDYTKKGNQIYDAYKAGEIFFIGDIPLSARSKYTLEEWAKEGEVSDALSTHTYVLNENAEINGTKLFANVFVRKALSLAIDREQIVKAVVFAEAATGIVPTGVFNANKKKETFRENSSGYISSKANLNEAMLAIANSGIVPANYSFSISVAAYDEVHLTIAEYVANSWRNLGFNVTVKPVALKENADKALTTNEKIAGIMDDVFMEDLMAGNYEVAAIDYVAFSADAFSTLAPFAKGYAGTATGSLTSPVFEVKPHFSGYNNDIYNQLIDEAAKTADPDARATLLHQAEGQLMTDMPIIPIVFNKNVTVKSKELSKVEFTYGLTTVFTKAKLKDYEKYLSETQS